MATESPLRLIGSSGARNWPASNDTATYCSSVSNVAVQELGMLLQGHGFQGDRIVTGPNRCGSAPPSIEGSLAALTNLRDQQNSSLDGSLESLSIAVGSCESEEQLRAHPSYLAYYCSNVNLNPRLPPPIISQENRRLVHHIGGFTDKWRMPSFDDNSKASSFISRPILSTHKEESEDERSPRLESNDSRDMNAGFAPRQSTSPLQGRHKSIVDLIQEDFPRTPSPVYNNQPYPSSQSLTEQAADQDPPIHSLHDSSAPNSDVAAVPVPCSVTTNRMMRPHTVYKGKPTSNKSILDNDTTPDTVSSASMSRNVRELKNLKISNTGPRTQHSRPRPQQNSSHPQGTSSQTSFAPSQTSISQSPVTVQGTHRSKYDVDNLSHGQSKLSSVDLQSVLQSTGVTPPLYASAAAYGAPYYPNMQSSNLIPPPFSMGGYTINTPLMPPFMTGYTPQSAIPIPYENHESSSNARASDVPIGGSITAGVNLQQFFKFYGQHGVAMQHSFPDPFYMPYLPQLSVDAYTGAGQYDMMLPDGSTTGSPLGNYDPQGQGRPYPTTVSSDRRTQVLRSETVSTSSARRAVGPNYYGSPPSIGVLMQYPTSPHSSPVFQGSPGNGTSFSVRKPDNMKLPLSPGRTPGAFSGWQGHRGRGKIDDLKSYSFLEELKSSRGRRFELSDIAGRIVEFSADQHGSRYIQQKLETCSIEEKSSVFDEVLPHVSTLMTDVFGNYVIQKFFEHGSPEQREKLANQLAGNILPLSLQMYGCRVIQKALEVIELDQKSLLVRELDGHVMQCVRDQNGNHVIQKCIECVPTEKIGFIISAFSGQVATLSMHPYGCRVIQRVLEHCSDEVLVQCIVDEILQSASVLAQDQYGNYVTQHVLERGKPHERSQIIRKLAGQVVPMSQHKFASNVIEKCLVHCDIAEQELLIEEIVGQTEGNDNLLIMMKDQFANYVIQKILDTCSEKQREVLLHRIRTHLQSLKKYTYGKHIVARVERLCGEDTHSAESGI